MQQQTEGLVLRARPYGESHKIVTMLTPQGKVALMARGASKPRSRLSAVTQPLTQGHYVFYRSSTSAMGSLNHGEYLHGFWHLAADLRLHYYAMYLAECLDKMIPEDSPEGGGWYSFALSWLKHLEAGKDPEVLKALFDLRLLAFAGYAPVFQHCYRCHSQEGPFFVSVAGGGIVCTRCQAPQSATGLFSVTPAVLKLLRLLQKIPIGRLGQIDLKPETSAQLIRVTQAFVDYYLDLPLKSREVLEELQQGPDI